MTSYSCGIELDASSTIRCVLASLYLRGLTRPFDPARSNWPMVAHALRVEPSSIGGAFRVLASRGFDEEAVVLQTGDALAQAERLVSRGRVFTALDSGYPSRWLERFGRSAPPVMWWNGVPFASGGGFSIVGSRVVSRGIRERVAALGEAAAERNLLIVSGGAKGCDRAGAVGASRVARESGAPWVDILPFGIEKASTFGGAALSFCEPWAEFSSAQAMERNALIYAWSPFTLVGHSRLREGGTWAGATDAIRRRLSRLLALDVPKAEGIEALISLGARRIKSARDLDDALSEPDIQGSFVFEDETRYGVETDEATSTYSDDVHKIDAYGRLYEPHVAYSG